MYTNKNEEKHRVSVNRLLSPTCVLVSLDSFSISDLLDLFPLLISVFSLFLSLCSFLSALFFLLLSSVFCMLSIFPLLLLVSL